MPNWVIRTLFGRAERLARTGTKHELNLLGCCDTCREAHGGMGIHEMTWEQAMKHM